MSRDDDDREPRLTRRQRRVRLLNEWMGLSAEPYTNRARLAEIEREYGALAITEAAFGPESEETKP